MIKLDKGQEPQVLRDNAETWTAQLRLARNPSERKRILKRYRHREIVARLNEETSGKCAYCESKIGAISYPHVEHIIPKSVNEELSFDWNNLTLACEVCNKRKLDYWNDELPLLNPYVDAPEQYLYGAAEWVRWWRSAPRGRVTVDLLDLNRGALQERRKQRMDLLEPLILAWRQTPSQAVRAAIWNELLRETRADREYVLVVRSYLFGQTHDLISEFQ